MVGLDLVGDDDDALLPAPLGDPRQESVGGYDEAALAEDRPEDHAGDRLPPTCLSITVMARLAARLRSAERARGR